MDFFKRSKLLQILALATALSGLSIGSAIAVDKPPEFNLLTKATEVPAGTWYVTNKDTQVRVNLTSNSGYFTNIPKGTWVIALGGNRTRINNHVFVYTNNPLLGANGWIDLADLD